MYPELTPTTPMIRSVGSDARSDRLSGNDAVAQRQLQSGDMAQPAGSGWFRDLLRSNREADGATAAPSLRRAAMIDLPLPTTGRWSETGSPGRWDGNEAPNERYGAAPAAADAEAPAASSPDDPRTASPDRSDDEASDDAGERDEEDRPPQDGREVAVPVQPPLIVPVASSGTTDDASLALLFTAPAPAPAPAPALAPATGTAPAPAPYSSPLAGGPGTADAPRTLPAEPAQTMVRAQTIAAPVTSVPGQLLVADETILAVDPAATPAPAAPTTDSPLVQGSRLSHQNGTGASPTGGAATTDGAGANAATGDMSATPSLAASANGPATGGTGAGGAGEEGAGTRQDDGAGTRPQTAGAGAAEGGDAGEDGGTFGIALSGLSGRTGTARIAGRAGKPSAAPSPAAQVAQQLGKAARSGLQRVEIALEPAALGRIDVRLEFGRDGRITAHFSAESREALDALRADARSLERALADAGVRADAGSLGFSLREQGSGDFASSRPAPMNPGAGDATEATGAGIDPAVTVADGTGGGADGRLDIRA